MAALLGEDAEFVGPLSLIPESRRAAAVVDVFVEDDYVVLHLHRR